MALTPFIVFLDGQVLAAADLNGSFNNILNNALQLVSPFTGNVDFDGNSLILDDDGDTSMTAASDDVVEFALNSAILFRLDGTVASPVNGIRLRFTASGFPPSIEVTGNPNRNLDLIPSGTGRVTQKGVEFEYDSDVHRAAQAFG